MYRYSDESRLWQEFEVFKLFTLANLYVGAYDAAIVYFGN